MDYQTFLEKKKDKDIPTGHTPHKINPMLFDFQRELCAWAIRRGRGAIFCDCGMGKTPMQLEWAHQVATKTAKPVLILAPLAVAKQTKREGDKFGYNDINICETQNDIGHCINITNYEKLHKFDCSIFSGIVLDESSCLKAYTSRYKALIIKTFQDTPYRLACTATPAPNDYNELGNHAEFLGIMTRAEMLAMFFINDTGDTGQWRLKGHAQDKFWEWMCTWSVMMRKPSDLGYNDEQFILPELNIKNKTIEYDGPVAGYLFAMEAKTLTERRQARKKTLNDRVKVTANIINSSNDIWIAWCNLNDESEMLAKSIDGAVEVRGNDSDQHKEKVMLDFADSKIKCLVTKPSIAGWGLNFQACHNMVFVGLSDSYEQYYQAVRRCWRFGQKKSVNAYIVTSELEGGVVANIKRKEKDAANMAENMAKHMSTLSKKEINGSQNEKISYEEDVAFDEDWVIYNADCVDAMAKIEDDSVHYSIFSPPFAALFTYSNAERDMGNCKDQENFLEHFKFMVKNLYRVMMPGRLVSFHVMNLPATIQHDGFIGMKDFRGDLIRVFEEFNFIYHSEVCIWKDPLVQATRTKVLTLAHKQISKDSSRCAQGFPDYVVTMRKPGDNLEPVEKGSGFNRYIGEQDAPIAKKTNNHRTNKYSHKVWQRYAAPVWWDINQSRTLNVKLAREKEDERHICPLQLDVIERCIELWTNPNDTVLSPFTGIGSEGYVAVEADRRFIGMELKKSYFDCAVKNMQSLSSKPKNLTLF